MITLRPLEDETPLEFVERADAHVIKDEEIDSTLKDHFNIREYGDTKRLRLQSRVFWRKFFVEHVRGIHRRGGSRYAAQRYIEKKNGHGGQEMFSQSEIDDLIDSIGKWSR
ncbi:hypothetical protein [Erythrobacter mangrovi]|uniref:Uncharacterized protein n=1 Tax=Erythrobacter mangrovi TaxID=2739433 RepID=A0A7D3XV94_9SPHN|nr:hypothetical protein [Erythrobacter mangrovi]QKG71116.1 hypothetical protein HQR01_06840 [Erythrobacter mangrovi]